MPGKRSTIVVAVAIVSALVAVTARVAAPFDAHRARYAAALACGIERWQIKTLQDRPRLLRPRVSTVTNLTNLPRPATIPFATRLPAERKIFSVEAAVTLVRHEADQDLHLVLEDGAAHMIAESPLTPTCTRNATRYRRRQMWPNALG